MFLSGLRVWVLSRVANAKAIRGRGACNQMYLFSCIKPEWIMAIVALLHARLAILQTGSGPPIPEFMLPRL